MKSRPWIADGCHGHPAFPTPRRGARFMHSPGASRRGIERAFSRHCEPTGRANARPMTGSAKQSILSLRGKMDCFASLAMTARAMDCFAETTEVSCKEPSDQTGYPTLTVNRKTGDVRAACLRKRDFLSG